MSLLRDFVTALRVLLGATDRVAAWRLGAAILLVVSGGLLAGLAPLALKGMIDAVTQARDTGRTATLSATTFGALYLAALCGGRLLNEWRPPLVGSAEQRLYGQLRCRFFGHLLELPLSFHLGRRSGALVHGLQQAIMGYQMMILHLVTGVVPVLVELATVTVVLVSLGQPALTATFAATALAYLLVLMLCAFLLKDGARAVSSADLDTHGMLADAVLNVEVIKCFNAEGTSRARFAQSARVLETYWTALHRERARMGLALTATFALSISASLAIALDAVTHGTLSVGGFVLTTAYMLQVVRPLEMLGAATRDLSQAVQFIRPLLDVLNEPSEQPRASAPGPAHRHARASADALSAVGEHGSPRIAFRGVSFAYGDGKPVLCGLSLDIVAGHSIAIVGASGSGKSSLVRLLLRLYEPQAGSIRLDGVAIDTLPVGALRALIALVPQDAVLFNDTIAFNIGIGRSGADRRDIERAARVARLHDLIASLPEGYDTRVGERGLRLSGGERQRVAIARAVLKRPRVYVLDEATSMLDSRTEIAILRNLRDHSAGCTTITIAHRLSTVRDADAIVVLEAGRVAERGSHATLLAKNGPYAALWRTQRGWME